MSNTDPTRDDSEAALEGVDTMLFDSSLDGMLVVDCASGAILKANGSAERLLGHAEGALVGRPYTVLFPDDSPSRSADVVDEIQSHDMVLRQTFRRADGARVRLDLTAVMLSAGGRDCILVTLRDASERDAHERRIADAARTDALTGLYSRTELMRRLESEHERAKRYGVPYSVCFVDVDNYKAVNDEHGHMVGDAVLRAFAALVCSELRANDFAGRYGGDEMVLVLPHTEPSTAFSVVERVRKKISAAPLRDGHREVTVTASFGIASARPGKTSVRQALEQADEALYEAKSLGRNRTCIYRPRERVDALRLRTGSDQ